MAASQTCKFDNFIHLWEKALRKTNKESPCLPVCIEDCVVEGKNIVQFIQLSGMSERMFVLFATRSLSDELQHDDDDDDDDDDEFVLAPCKIIDRGKTGYI